MDSMLMWIVGEKFIEGSRWSPPPGLGAAVQMVAMRAKLSTGSSRTGSRMPPAKRERVGGI